MNTEIELYSKMQDPLAAIDRLGEMFAKSGMFGCEKVEQGKVLAVICMAEKKSPVAITRDFDIVEGKLRKKALAALADFRTMGGKHKWIQSGDEPNAKEEDWKAVLWLKDRDGNEITYAYSMADARKEGLIKDKSRWAKRPGNMLRARCISNGTGMLCPELYAGDDSDTETERPALLPTNEKTIEAEVVSERTDTAAASHAPGAQAQANATNVESSPAPVTASSANETRKFTAQDIHINPSNPNLLSDETCLALTTSFGADCTAAIEWLKAKKWIVDEIAQLSPERARRLIEKPDAFMATVKGATK